MRHIVSINIKVFELSFSMKMSSPSYLITRLAAYTDHEACKVITLLLSAGSQLRLSGGYVVYVMRQL